MIKYTLHNKLHWNAVKYHERADGFSVSPQSATDIAKKLKVKTHKVLQEKLNFRSKYLDERQRLIQSVTRVKSYFFLGAFILILFAGILGFISTSIILNAQSHSHTINFYGVLVALLGANSLALLLWVFMLLLSVFFSPVQWGMKKLTHRLITLKYSDARNDAKSDKQYALSAVQSWGDFLFKSFAGRWCVSTLMHLVWSVFLLGCLACIVYKLSVQHYQFVWESTLLSGDVFTRLTHALAVLPNALGLATPTIEHIQQSQFQVGASPAVTSDASHAWAMLLIGSLLVYGVGPRLILVVVCAVLGYVFTQRWLPNFDEPYYQKLMLELTPSYADDLILDEDNAPMPLKIFNQPNELLNPTSTKKLTHWLAQSAPWYCAVFEMSAPPEHWVPSEWDKCVDLGLLNDRDSINRMQSNLRSDTRLLLLCNVNAVPDRGAERILAEFNHASQECVLVLWASKDWSKTRLAQWLQVSTRIKPAHTLVVNDDMDILKP